LPSCQIETLERVSGNPHGLVMINSIAKMKFRLLPILALTVATGVAPPLGAAPDALSISVPEFLIPLGGQAGTLTLYADGRAPETSGFNALGRQRLTVAAHGVSSGTLTLNLVFPGFLLEDPATAIGGARFGLRMSDVDFMADHIAPGVTLTETAELTAINGIPLASLIDLGRYVPSGTRDTDNQVVTLDPVRMDGPALPANFAAPFTLSFTLTARLVNDGPRPFSMINRPESVNSEINLDLVPANVPEPSTWALIGLGGALLGLTQVLRRSR
jgi:hypothetical protein